jgi:hypothetical protein
MAEDCEFRRIFGICLASDAFYRLIIESQKNSDRFKKLTK